MTVDAALRRRTIALVGLMGVGKTTIGRKLATALELPFYDTGRGIERAAGCTIADLFSELGEAEFRAGERRVIGRLLEGPPHVLATGGGAFMNPETRALIAQKAVSVWLKADLDVMARRVGRKETRPLLTGREPRQVLAALMKERYPVYAEADIVIETDDRPAGAAAEAIVDALRNRLEAVE